jgi:hypothetical protein
MGGKKIKIAIITEKYPGGKSKTIRTNDPLTTNVEKIAVDLDEYLTKRISSIERELIDKKLMNEIIPTNIKRTQGNVILWHTLGTRLREICEEKNILSRRERYWLWEAIENIHATDRIKRAKRGRTRNHFEYCYRLSRFPIEFAEQLNWSEWVYFFDSRTVREEPRIDDWLKTLVDRDEKINRELFRLFTQSLNKRIQKLDTSILTDRELFSIYDEILKKVKDELR